MLGIVYTTKMKRDVKRMQKRGKDMSKLTAVLDILASESPSPKSTVIIRSKEKCKVIANVIYTATRQ